MNEETKIHVANLRRLDWRFLLPAPQGEKFRHLLLLGGPKALADRIIEAKLAERVSCEIKAGSRADAVILLHNSPFTMEQAAASLEEGGVFYQEIARRPFISPPATTARLQQQLQAVGLTLTGLYWAAPNFEECRRYLPLDLPGALNWYISSLFVAGSPAYYLLRTLFRLVVGKSKNYLGWFVPNVCLTAIAGPEQNCPPSVLGNPQVANRLQKGTLRPLLLTSGQDDASRLIMLPFATQPAQQDQQPVAVIKIATAPNFNNETEVEQTVLHEVREHLDGKTRQSVPEPLGTFHYRGLAVGIESCAPGSSLWASSGEWGASIPHKIADLELSAKWLTDFHRQTEIERLSWDQQSIERWVEMPLAAYAQVREVTEAEKLLFAAMRSHANSLIGAEFPLVWQHNDFAPWNLYRQGVHLTVIDWEFNRNWEHTRAGPALCDLLYFVTYWNHVAHHLYSPETELAGMRELFVEAAPHKQTIQAARQAIAHYMADLKIDWRFLPLLLVYTWAERVVYSAGRAEKLAGAGNKSRAAGKFANYIALFASHRETLFAAHGGSFWQAYAVDSETLPIDAARAEALG